MFKVCVKFSGGVENFLVALTNFQGVACEIFREC